MKIGVCSLFIGEKYDDKNAKYCKRSIIDYCKKNKYDFLYDTNKLDKNSNEKWSKLLMILKMLNSAMPSYDYVVWLDGDIMIMNDEILLENRIKDYMGNKDFMLASEPGADHINTGVWYVKNNEYTKNIIDMISKLPELRKVLYDQEVFNNVYNRNIFKLKDHCEILPKEFSYLINCYYGWYRYGMFLVHFWGMNGDELIIQNNQFYPKQKDDETEFQYNHRLTTWLMKLGT